MRRLVEILLTFLAIIPLAIVWSFLLDANWLTEDEKLLSCIVMVFIIPISGICVQLILKKLWRE